MIRIITSLLVGVCIGLTLAYPFMKWVIERDRILIEVASFSGEALFYSKRLDSEVNCVVLQQVLARIRYLDEVIPELGSPRFYEPPRMVVVFENELEKLHMTYQSENILRLREQCGL